MNRSTFVDRPIAIAAALLLTLIFSAAPTNSATASTALEQESDIEGLYKLPDHSGRLIVVVDDEQMGMPNLSADYDVDIHGDLATVTVTQTFENSTDRVLEPIYEFPLYEQAAVFAMSMKIGETRVDAEIKRREEAREIYEEAKERGQQAALLDQDRPNLFVQRVANVEPGQEVEIVLRYTHALPRDRGLYHLAIPLRVPERYTPSDMSENHLVDSDGSDDPGATAGGTNSAARDAEKPDEVSITVNIDGGMPVTNLASPSHTLDITSETDAVHTATLADDGDPTTRHFRMSYQLAGDEIGIGANSYWSEANDLGYFDLLIEPPAEVAAELIPNREVIFVVDQSGSMSRDRIRTARGLVKTTLGQLRPDDYFRIVTFNNDFREFSDEPLLATEENITRAQGYIGAVEADGGTEIVPPMRAVLESPMPPDTMRMIVVLTDVEVSNEFEVIRLVQEEIGDARIYAIGIGGSVNRYLLEALGRAGRGFSTQFGMNDDVERITDDAVRRLQSPVLTDVSVDWGTLNATDITPTALPDVFEGGAIRLQGRFDNPGRHTIEIHGTLAGEEVTFEHEVDFSQADQDGESVRLAWARQTIRDKMHDLMTPEELRGEEVTDDSIKESITELGLAYSLTTQWTSLVAVADDETLESSADSGSGRSGNSSGTTLFDFDNHMVDGSFLANENLDAFGGARGGSAPDTSTGESMKRPPARSMDFEVIDISDDEHTRIVMHMIHRERSSLRRCYERELLNEPDIAGTFEIHFSLHGDRTLQVIRISDSSLDSEPVESCTSEIIGSMHGRPFDSDEPVFVTVKFEFDTE